MAVWVWSILKHYLFATAANDKSWMSLRCKAVDISYRTMVRCRIVRTEIAYFGKRKWKKVHTMMPNGDSMMNDDLESIVIAIDCRERLQNMMIYCAIWCIDRWFVSNVYEIRPNTFQQIKFIWIWIRFRLCYGSLYWLNYFLHFSFWRFTVQLCLLFNF